MTAPAAIRKLTTFAVGSFGKLKEIWMLLGRILTLSLGDDTIAPRKNLSVSLEKGRLSVVYGSRFLSRIAIKGVKEFLFEERRNPSRTALSRGRYPQPADLASSMTLAANEFGTPRQDVTLSIPKAWAIIRTAEFPSTIKENISDVVSFEMDRLTPLMPEDAFYDFRVLNDTGERLTLLIVAAKANTIRPYIKSLNESGFNVSGLTVNICGVGTLCHYMERKIDTVFVEIDENGYEGAFFVSGSPSHLFSNDMSSGDERAKVDEISKEIMSLINTAKAGQGRVPQIAVLIKDKNPALRELLKAYINMPVRFIEEMDPGINLPISRQEIPYAAVGSLLQSVWPKAQGPNLLKKGIYEKQKTPFALTVILACALIAMGVLYVVAPLWVEEKRLQEISSQIVPRKEQARKVEALKKDADALSSEIVAINDFKGARTMDLNILADLTSVLPKNAWLTRLRITDTSVEIEGYANSATELLPKLEASKYMRKVEFASPTFRDVRLNADRFSIKMEIVGVKKKEDKIKGDKGKNEKK